MYMYKRKSDPNVEDCGRVGKLSIQCSSNLAGDSNVIHLTCDRSI